MPAKRIPESIVERKVTKALPENNNLKLIQKILMLLLMDDGKTYQEIKGASQFCKNKRRNIICDTSARIIFRLNRVLFLLLAPDGATK